MRSAPLVVAVALLAAPAARAQGLSADEGHCAMNGRTTLSCWNPQAGRAMAEGEHPEFLPFLQGWDFRVNLPHVRLQRALAGAGGPPALVGVVEDATPPDALNGSLARYGHTNNAIWLMRVQGADGRLHVKSLPSRRNSATSTVENVSSLVTGWERVGGALAPELRAEKPAATVVGAGLGIGKATVVVVARRERDARLLVAQRTMNTASPVWSSVSWSAMGASSSTPPSAVAAFGDRVAVAWRDPASQKIRVRLYAPGTQSWGPTAEIDARAAGTPQLVWDGTALNLFFVDAASRRLQHTLATASAPLAFRDRVAVASTPVLRGFHALAYNGRLHVAFISTIGLPLLGNVRYTVSRVEPGQRSSWVAPAPARFSATTVQLAPLRDNLFLVGIGRDNRLRFARRDPNVPGPESTGTNSSRLWLTPGEQLDPSRALFRGLETLFFNSDVYLATADAGGVRVMNMSRAAMKLLITRRWGIQLRWGEAGGGLLTSDFARGEDVPLVGDVDNDGMDDLLRFVQRGTPDGTAPVYVAASRAGWASQGSWHPYFSERGEIPRVGNFDGLGGDDIATFVQRRQHNADGSVLGNAPVWVALSDGTRFGGSGVWHRFFSLKGEIPLVGDFNGDGKDDIATFVQRRQHRADGSVLGNAPVWVALSDGTRFGTSRVWHTFFSLRGEVPAVGDVNFDGRDDIVTFLHDRVTDVNARAVFTAVSDGSRFGRSTTWASDFARKSQIPLLARLGGPLSAITGRPTDARRRPLDIVAFDKTNGSVAQLRAMGQVPSPSGAPWERYKWFTDKGQGVAAFPEWIWRRPGHCISSRHPFMLLGLGGSGGADVTNLSVRIGSRLGHVMEELGHSTFANCFNKPSDPLNAAIFTSAGINANALHGTGELSDLDCGTAREPITIPPPEGTGAPGTFHDCRDAEHYFLELLKRYRLYGDEFRRAIATTQDAGRRQRLTFQYGWLRDNWFGGAQYKRGPAMAASLPAEGMLCLPNECKLAPQPLIVVRPASLSFGRVRLGETVTRTFRIENRGEADLEISISASPANSPFTWQGMQGTDVAPGRSIGVRVQFTPPTAGRATRTLLVRSNAAGSRTLPLVGTGVDDTDAPLDRRAASRRR